MSLRALLSTTARSSRDINGRSRSVMLARWYRAAGQSLSSSYGVYPGNDGTLPAFALPCASVVRSVPYCAQRNATEQAINKIR
eukprot:2808634-Pleurochrysis_carterae.AAC.1